MDIVTFPHQALTTKAEEITEFAEVESLASEMIETAIAHDLVGLAANQVGVLKRIFVMNTSKDENPDWIVCVNPRVKVNKERGEEFMFEGCGSLPNINCLVKRFKSVELVAQNTKGESFSMTLNGFQARIAQHENNHLDGILMTSKARQIKRISVKA